MTITAFQVQHIIRSYNQQLKVRGHGGAAEVPAGENLIASDVVKISEEGRRRSAREGEKADVAKENIRSNQSYE